MKKVGIVTINDISNYGNRLQNFTLQYYLKEMSIFSENILELKKHNLSYIYRDNKLEELMSVNNECIELFGNDKQVLKS